MMDMEMNAELERDGGSDEGDASTEASSAGSVYCTLEQDFARITNEMKSNDALAVYQAEYTRLFECLYKAHRLEEDLTEKCRILKDEITESSNQILTLEKKVEKDAINIEQLKKEILDGKRLADAAHTREQKSREVIENLRLSISKLTDELEQKNKQLSTDEHNVKASKQKDGSSKERERLLGEVETLKQRLKTVSSYNQEIEHKLSEAERQINEMQEKIDRQNNDMTKEHREREILESELQTTHDELRLRTADLQAADDALKKSSISAAKQNDAFTEQKLEIEKNHKEIQKLLVKQMTMKSELDRLNTRHDETKKELIDKNKTIKDMAREIQRLKEELSKIKSEKESTMKKLVTEKSLSIKTDEKVTRMSADLRNAEMEIAIFRKQVENEKKTIEKLSREKDAAQKNITLLEDLNKKITLEIQVYEQTNRKMESTIDEMTSNSNEMKRQIKSIEKERDRYMLESQELTHQVEDYVDDVKLKQLEINDYQKRINETEVKIRQQLTLLEDIRAERNSYKKNLLLAQEEIINLKGKIKNLNLEIDKLREQVSVNEANLLKQEFLYNKLEKEKDGLKGDLEDSCKTISDLRKENDELRREEKRLRGVLLEADTTIARKKKEIDSALKERDVIGTQIVRRNDEISLLHNKNQILTDTLTKGEKQYAQKLEEIKMLKIEIKNLKLEIAALEKINTNLSDKRDEVFHLERDLTKERLKVTALEEEVQNPLNVHRWRNLEGTDPDTYELVKKIQFLQKRILRMSTEIIAKEQKIKDTEKLYMNLREFIAKQPGPEVLVCLRKTQKALRDRGKKIKCLAAELNMTFSSEYKFEIEKIRQELNSVKAQCVAQKKKELKSVDSTKRNVTTLQSHTIKFAGGGYNFTPVTKSITTPTITLSK